MRNLRAFRRIGVGCCAAVLLMALPASGALAAAEVRYAGTLVAVDMAAGTLVVEDMGPVMGDARSRITRQRVKVDPSTQFALVKRTMDVGPAGWGGTYVETPLAASAVKDGDYAVVSIGSDKHAVKVTVVDPREP